MVQNVPYDVDLMHELLKSSSSTREDVLKRFVTQFVKFEARADVNLKVSSKAAALVTARSSAKIENGRFTNL